MAITGSARKTIVFSTNDFFGNPVTLYTNTLETHILTDHTDMPGFEHGIQPAVETPDAVLESTISSTAAVFELVGAGEGGRDLRVLVGYDHTSFAAGTSKGIIMTAYPRDEKRYPRPRVGKAIYKKRKSS